MLRPSQLIAVSLLVASCSGDNESASPSQVQEPVETPSDEAPVVEGGEGDEPGDVEAGDDNEAIMESEVATPEPQAPSVVWGGLVMLLEAVETAEHDEVEGPFVLWTRVETQPKPNGEPTGYIYTGSGYNEIRLIREMPMEYSVVTVVGREGSCEVQVVRAMELHLFLPPEDRYDEEGEYEWTYRAHELRSGCPSGRGEFAVAGRHTSEVHSFRTSDMTTPASPEQVALVRESDEAVGAAPPLPTDAYRVQDFPELGFCLVSGISAWVVRDGVVYGHLGGTTNRFFHVGPLVLFDMSSPDSGWLVSIDDMTPVPITCVVDDPSGTPLNVRSAPRRGAPIVERLSPLINGTEVYVGETRGSWRRLTQADRPQNEWVHASLLRCPR